MYIYYCSLFIRMVAAAIFAFAIASISVKFIRNVDTFPGLLTFLNQIFDFLGHRKVYRCGEL